MSAPRAAGRVCLAWLAAAAIALAARADQAAAQAPALPTLRIEMDTRSLASRLVPGSDWLVSLANPGGPVQTGAITRAAFERAAASRFPPAVAGAPTDLCALLSLDADELWPGALGPRVYLRVAVALTACDGNALEHFVFAETESAFGDDDHAVARAVERAAAAAARRFLRAAGDSGPVAASLRARGKSAEGFHPAEPARPLSLFWVEAGGGYLAANNGGGALWARAGLSGARLFGRATFAVWAPGFDTSPVFGTTSDTARVRSAAAGLDAGSALRLGPFELQLGAGLQVVFGELVVPYLSNQFLRVGEADLPFRKLVPSVFAGAVYSSATSLPGGARLRTCVEGRLSFFTSMHVEELRGDVQLAGPAVLLLVGLEFPGPGAARAAAGAAR